MKLRKLMGNLLFFSIMLMSNSRYFTILFGQRGFKPLLPDFSFG